MLQSLFEFYRITQKTGGSPKIWFALPFAALFFLFFFLYKNSLIAAKFGYILVALVFVSFAVELLRKGSALKNLSTEFMGIVYVAFPFVLSNFIVFAKAEFNYHILLSIFFVIWAYDITAYFVGSKFGKRKIFPDISPNKSLEGTLGGFFFGVVAGFLVYKIFDTYSLLDWLIMSVLIVFGAFVGDLVESKLKRSANVKDSGKIMPGHGGLLDRLDSFLFAIIAVSLYMVFFL